MACFKVLFMKRLPALAAALMSSLALGLSFWSGVSCDFVRVVSFPSPLTIIVDYSNEVNAQEQRLSQLQEIEENENDLEDVYYHSLGVFCKSDLYDTDKIWMISQIFLAVALSFGLCTSIVSWSIALFLQPNAWNWKCVSIFSALTSVLQIPVFLLLDARPCKLNETHMCKIRSGFFFMICSCVLYVAVTVLTQWYDPPNWLPEANMWKAKSKLTDVMDVMAGGMSWIDSKSRRQFARMVSSHHTYNSHYHTYNSHSHTYAGQEPEPEQEQEQNLFIHHPNHKSDAIPTTTQIKKHRSWLPNFSSYQEIKEEHPPHDDEDNNDEEEGLYDVYNDSDLMLHIVRPDDHSHLSNNDTFDDSLSLHSLHSKSTSTSRNSHKPPKQTKAIPSSTIFPIREVLLEKDPDCNTRLNPITNTNTNTNITQDTPKKDDDSTTFQSARSSISSQHSTLSIPTPTKKQMILPTYNNTHHLPIIRPPIDHSHLSDAPGTKLCTSKSTNQNSSSLLEQIQAHSQTQSKSQTQSQNQTQTQRDKMKRIGAQIRANKTSTPFSLQKVDMSKTDNNDVSVIVESDKDSTSKKSSSRQQQQQVLLDPIDTPHHPNLKSPTTMESETPSATILSPPIHDSNSIHTTPSETSPNVTNTLTQDTDIDEVVTISNSSKSSKSKSHTSSSLSVLQPESGYSSEVFRTRGRELRLQRLTSSRKKNKTKPHSEDKQDSQIPSIPQRIASFSDTDENIQRFGRALVSIPSVRHTNRNWDLAGSRPPSITNPLPNGRFNKALSPSIVPFESPSKTKFYNNSSSSDYYYDTSDSETGPNTKKYDALRRKTRCKRLLVQQQEQPQTPPPSIVTPKKDISNHQLYHHDSNLRDESNIKLVPTLQNPYSIVPITPHNIPTITNHISPTLPIETPSVKQSKFLVTTHPSSPISPHIREKYEYKPGKSLVYPRVRANTTYRQNKLSMQKGSSKSVDVAKHDMRVCSQSMHTGKVMVPRLNNVSPVTRRYESPSQNMSRFPLISRAQSQSPLQRRILKNSKADRKSERRSKSVSHEARMSRIRRMSEDSTDSSIFQKIHVISPVPTKLPRSRNASPSSRTYQTPKLRGQKCGQKVLFYRDN